MSAPRDLDGLLTTFLKEGPLELPDPSYDQVRDRMDHTRQRTFIGPWRTPGMNRYLKIGLAAAAVVVVAVVGYNLLPGSAGPGAGQTATPVPSIAEPSPPSPPPLTQTFTSQMHGISVSYPEGWIARAATEPWGPEGPNFSDPFVDVLYDPVLEGNLHLRFASQPIGDSTPDEWVAEQLAGDGCSATEPITVDGVTGLIGANDCSTVAVATAGRGYWIRLHTSPDDPLAVAAYDRAWFEEVLATVQLHPEDAVDGGASPSP
jgi:hypothetical protein